MRRGKKKSKHTRRITPDTPARYKPHKHGPFAVLKKLDLSPAPTAQAPRPVANDSVHVFTKAMEGVTPLKPQNRINHSPVLPPPLPIKRWEDEQQVLSDALSDDFATEWLIETDESLSYRRSGIGLNVIKQLRKGKWVVQTQLDLHGYRVDEARLVVSDFLKSCVKRQLRCVRIIHGKGLGSVNRVPVLKEKVRRWLIQKDEVLAFVEALPYDGGSGVLLVLLKYLPYKA